MALYRGERTLDGIVVTADGQPLDPAFSLRKLATLGFEWGYEGAAPGQLALALLAHHLGDGARALALYERFMKAVVAHFGNDWAISGADIDTFLAAGRAQAAASH